MPAQPNPVTAVVLAAGKGTRMKSATPKVLHAIAGRPMIHYPVRAALEAGADRVVVVVGHGRDRVEPYLRETFGDRVELVVQEEQKGTGHAVLVALAAIGKGRNGKDTPQDARVLILSGDTPLLRVEDLRGLLAAADADSKADIALLTATLKDATGYGRIVRRGGFVVAIKEHKDCTEEERTIHEINPAVYAVRYAFLAAHLPKLKPNNAQGELYLTDLIAAAATAGGVVDRIAEAASLEGINDRAQLAELDGRMLAAIIKKHQLAGVTVRDPSSTEIHDSVTIGAEVVIERGVVLRGATKIEDGATLDVGCVLTDVTVAASANLKPYTIASQSKIGPKAQIGPFSHLRPASDVGEDAHVGNFVELKKTRLGKGSKANHLAYLGDGEVGEGVNVGAGTIFCNYDGFKKHVTTLEDGVFIGSDSQLVAPVRVGKGAYVGTGTTVTKDVPAGALAIGRVKQENKEGYADKLKARLKAGK